MATYTSNACASTVQPRSGIGLQSFTHKHTVATALVASDIVQLVPVPLGACIQEIIISCDASLGSTLTAELGDDGDTDRFIASATFAQGAAQTATRLTAVAGHGYVYTADNTIDLKINTAAAGTTGAIITTTIIYSMYTLI